MSSKTVEEAFKGWFKRIDAYNSMPTIEDAFAAGAAHGAAEEREWLLEIIAKKKADIQKIIDPERSVMFNLPAEEHIRALDGLEARIRQRGEK